MNIKIDKRSQRTREALKKTLAQMMIKQNINDITIKNLVVLANINRSTFYLHYTDIFDLLQEGKRHYFPGFRRYLIPILHYRELKVTVL